MEISYKGLWTYNKLTCETEGTSSIRHYHLPPVIQVLQNIFEQIQKIEKLSAH